MHRNLDKAREAMRRWRARNLELKRARDRAYRRAAYRRDPAKAKSQRNAYLAVHPEIKRAADHAYRARRMEAQGSFTGAEWHALLEQWGNVCAYCGGGGPLEAEHRIPLSRGGTNYIENILPACRGCNGTKHKMTEEEFRARLHVERRAAPARERGGAAPIE